jgi:nucleoside-diphosphate-sugar epimerase
MRRVLITGVTGTLGFNILRQLAERPNLHITAPVRRMIPQLGAFAGRAEFIEHELEDVAHTAQIFERARPDVILHCAASGLRPPKGTWFDLMQFNVVTAMRLFQMNCRFNHDSHFIYISTGLVYQGQDRPLVESDPIETLHPYGASKAAADSMLQAAAAEFGRRLTIVRPFAFTGPHDGGGRLFPEILRSAVEGCTMPLTDGKQVRDFCAVQDIARAVVTCVEREPKKNIEKFNLGSGQQVPLREMIEQVCEAIGLKTKLEFGKVKRNPLEPSYLVADISHARKELDWEPRIPLAEAVWELAQEVAPQLKLKRPEASA